MSGTAEAKWEGKSGVRPVVIIQARMSSTRLPGKVLKPLGSKTVLEQVIDRVSKAPVQVVVATSDQPEDDAIVRECERLDVASFRGSLQDVLSRYYHAAVAFHAETVVRVTSDCPLFDGDLLAAMLERFAAAHVDYMSNFVERTYPRGLDAEIMRFSALQEAYLQATDAGEREHVTPYIYRHPERFRLGAYAQEERDDSGHRWTLDTPEDYAMLQAVVQALGNDCTTGQVLAYLAANPLVRAMNAHIEQKAH